MAEGGLERRDPTLLGGSARSKFTLGALIQVAGEDDSAQFHAQVSDKQQERDAHRPPLGAVVVDVNIGDCEIGARQVGRSAELAGTHHTLEGPTENT